MLELAMLRALSLTLAVSVGIGMSADAQTRGGASSNLFTVTGVVKAVSASSLTLGFGSDQMVFAIIPSTRFVGKGPPRDLLLRERRAGAADFVKPGDRVTVGYRPSDGALTAVQVRILQRAVQR